MGVSRGLSKTLVFKKLSRFGGMASRAIRAIVPHAYDHHQKY